MVSIKLTYTSLSVNKYFDGYSVYTNPLTDSTHEDHSRSERNHARLAHVLHIVLHSCQPQDVLHDRRRASEDGQRSRVLARTGLFVGVRADSKVDEAFLDEAFLNNE